MSCSDGMYNSLLNEAFSHLEKLTEGVSRGGLSPNEIESALDDLKGELEEAQEVISRD